jgi:hypothetical protein
MWEDGRFPLFLFLSLFLYRFTTTIACIDKTRGMTCALRDPHDVFQTLEVASDQISIQALPHFTWKNPLQRPQSFSILRKAIKSPDPEWRGIGILVTSLISKSSSQRHRMSWKRFHA